MNKFGLISVRAVPNTFTGFHPHFMLEVIFLNIKAQTTLFHVRVYTNLLPNILFLCQKKKKKRYKKHTDVIKHGSVIHDINCSPFQVQVANLKKQTENKTKLSI